MVDPERLERDREKAEVEVERRNFATTNGFAVDDGKKKEFSSPPFSYPRHITALSSVHSSIAGAHRQMSHCGGWAQGVAATASCEAPAEPAAWALFFLDVLSLKISSIK